MRTSMRKGARARQNKELASLAAGLVRLGEALAKAVAENDDAPNVDPWIPHGQWPWPHRTSLDLARSGRIEAVKNGKAWLARASEIDRMVLELAAETPERSCVVDEIEAAARRAGGGR